MRSRPSRYRHRLLASATLLALGPALAQAQASGTASAPPAPSPAASAPETVMPVIRATATGVKETATSPVPGYVARRSATATKTDTPLNEVPQSVTVITADQVKDQGSANLQEALRYSAGVRHEVYGIDNRGDWFGLRGSEESTLLLDSMRQPLSGWWGIVRTAAPRRSSPAPTTPAASSTWCPSGRSRWPRARSAWCWAAMRTRNCRPT
jgi:iron complex outermembrane receptor protein